MEQKEIKSIIECLLFVSDKPFSLNAIQGMLEDVDRRTVLACLDELKAEYDLQGRAFHLVEIAEGYQLATRVQFAPWIRKMFKTRTSNKLSRAALETLAIIAYRQPITKAEIEDIRGVSADGVVNALLDRKFIRIVGRKEVIGRPILYGTTKEFLHYFGLKDLTDMPMLKDLQDILEADDAGQAWEMNQQGELIAKVKVQEEGEADNEKEDATTPDESKSENVDQSSEAEQVESAPETSETSDEVKSEVEQPGVEPASGTEATEDDVVESEKADVVHDEDSDDDEVHLEDGNGHSEDQTQAEELVAAEIQASESNDESESLESRNEAEKDDSAGA